MARRLILRDASGNLNPDLIGVDAHFGEIFIDDGSGFVSASDATAEIIDATPVKVGQLNGVAADAAERAATSSGALTVTRPGDYEVYAHGDVALAGAADTFLCEVYKNGAVVADAAASPGGEISANVVAVGTGAQGWGLRGLLRGLVAGDDIDLRVTVTGSSTATIKQLRFGIRQVADSDPPMDSADA